MNLEKLMTELDSIEFNKNAVINQNSQGQSLSWTEYPDSDLNDDNRSFTLELYPINETEYELTWEGDTIASGGEYNKTIKSEEDFEMAMLDWETMKNWY